MHFHYFNFRKVLISYNQISYKKFKYKNTEIQMSNKNLKVYRIEFITEVQDMHFKVKFPCQVKMIWKRSNETAETTLVPVQNGIVHFNQTLKMYVNMYFDTVNNRFVQKKCMYSFLIVTDKGEKSAGSVTYDLSQFFNKRIYEIQQDFSLQKCPLPDTKIRMKIYYQQSSEQGYDSFSRISTSEQLDLSTASMDLSQDHNPTQKQVFSKSNSKIEQNKSKKSETDDSTSKKSQQEKQEVQSNMDVLNESDLGERMQVNLGLNSGIQDKNEKITENIQALNKITGKINQFVSKCSGNIKTQIQNIKHKNKGLEQSLSASKFQIQKLAKEKQQYKGTISNLKKQLSDQKLNHESIQKSHAQKHQQLTHKYEQSQKLCSQLENNLSQKGQSQTSYMKELKASFAETEQKQKQKIQSLNSEIIAQKKEKNQLSNQNTKLSAKLKQMQDKLTESSERIKGYQMRQSQRQKQLAELRYKLQHVYEDVVKALGSIGVGH